MCQCWAWKVTCEDIELQSPQSSHQEEESRNEEQEKREDGFSQDTESTSSLKEVEYEKVEVGHWVKVIYEEHSSEKWSKRAESQKFNVSRNLLAWRNHNRWKKMRLFFINMFFCNVRPKLQKFGGSWKYIY